MSRQETTLVRQEGYTKHNYGIICLVDTPEGKNIGLVNLLTSNASIEASGLINMPYHKNVV
ncbi:MAG: hypothetical protein ACKESA_01410 [Candidatus Hodgkinia cicadicola]